MISLLKNATLFNLKYNAYALTPQSSTSGYSPDKAFDDDDYYFHIKGSGSLDEWWQVSFSKEVLIGSYIIKTLSKCVNRLNKWIINASLDNKTWETVHSMSNYDTVDNKTPFNLSQTVYCKHFRVVAKGNTDNNYQFHISYFDCYIPSPRVIKVCPTRYSIYLKYMLFFDVLISSFSVSFS